MAAKTKCKLNCSCKLNADPFQWWIQGRGWGAPPSPHPLIFGPNWGPNGEKNFLGDQPPPPPLPKGLDDRAPLISRAGSGTAFVPGPKHLIGGGNKTYHCNCTAVKTPRLRFLVKLFLKLIPGRRLYLVRLWGTLVVLVFIFHKTCMLGTPDSPFQGF